MKEEDLDGRYRVVSLGGLKHETARTRAHLLSSKASDAEQRLRNQVVWTEGKRFSGRITQNGKSFIGVVVGAA